MDTTLTSRQDFARLALPTHSSARTCGPATLRERRFPLMLYISRGKDETEPPHYDTTR